MTENDHTQNQTDEVKSDLEKGLEMSVEECRITLVDDHDEEYEFIILDELSYDGKDYLALVSCDEKTDMGSGNDPGESNDITIVRKFEQGGEISFTAVTDADELYGISKLVNEKYGHL